jgi:hypothetical protein
MHRRLSTNPTGVVLERIRTTAESMIRTYRAMDARRPSDVCSDQRVDPEYFRMLSAFSRDVRDLRADGVRVDRMLRSLDGDHGSD